jgi:hypothetical protein
MMPKSWNTGVTDLLQRHPLLSNRFLKHISLATNMHVTVEELLGAVFSNQSALKLCKEGQRDQEEAYRWRRGRIPPP